MVKKINKIIKGSRFSMRVKLVLGSLSIAVVLLVACFISVREYTAMSNYVSSLIAEDIESINVAGKLSGMCDDYNMQILSIIGEESSQALPEFDDEVFRSQCERLARADSVMYSYAAYMLTSMELEDVMASDFINTRTWYYERLQPKFRRLHDDFGALAESIHEDLIRNSETFERGFYRSLVPGVVAVAAGMLLMLMFMFFLLADYVNPIYRMLDSLKAYRSSDKKYSYSFDGDDQLCELNDGIAEIADENQILHKRIAELRKKTMSGEQ